MANYTSSYTGAQIDQVVGANLLSSPNQDFYVSASESDQGVASSGGESTVKDFVDSLGSNLGTIIFKHQAAGTSTAYVLSTSITVPDNIKLQYENGAMHKPDAGIVLTVHSPEHIIATPRQQIVDMTNNSTDPLGFTVGGTVYPGWWGAVADGVMATGSGTDNSNAINAAFLIAYTVGGKVKLPSGIYKTLTTVGVSIDSATAEKAFPTFEGDQASQVQPDQTDANQTGTILMLNDVAGATTALRAYNADSTEAGYIIGGEIRNLKIIRVNNSGPQDQPTDSASSIGIETRLWVDFRMYNVVVQGFYYGWYTSWCWSWDVFGFSATRNNYGIWMDRHTNAVSVNGFQGHQNNIGIRINAGYGIQINRTTLEGQDYGLIVCNNDAAKAGPRKVSIDGYNSEQNVTAEILLGIDDGDTESTNTIYGVKIDNFFVNTPPGTIVKTAKVENVLLDGNLWSEEPFLQISGSNTRNVRISGHPGEDAYHLAYQEAVDHRIGYRHPYNLIPNGWTQFPSLEMIRGETGTVDWYDDSGDSARTVLRIESSDGDSSTKIAKIYIQLDERMATEKMRLSLGAKVDASVTVSAAIYDATDTIIAASSIGNFTTSWAVYSGDFTTPTGEGLMYLAIVATNSSGVSKYVYLENIVVAFREVGELIQSPIDVLAGLSGKATTDASGDATVTLTARYGSYYTVQATVMEATNAIVRVVRSSGSFAIKTVDKDDGNVANVDVAWLVIPHAGIYGGY